MVNSVLTPAVVECPKCGKHSIVPAADGAYHCLNCDFKKDIKDDDRESGEDGPSVLVGILTFIAVLLVVL